MGALSTAVQQEQWQVAAYLLLIGLAKVAARVPPETLAELLALLQTAPGHEVPGARPALPAHRRRRGTP